MDVDARAVFLRFFGDLPDPRAANRRHLLHDLLVIAVLAVLCRCDDVEEIVAWGEAHEPWLRTFLDLPHGIASPDTFERVLARLDPLALERALIAWAAALAEASGGRLIAIDGKSLRRSFHSAGATALVHMVSAWCEGNRLALAQLATDQKSNEITAIPGLLELLDLKGATVSIDAAGCQKAIAGKIVAGGGDYLLAVKKNQKGLHEAVGFYFDEAIREGWEGLPRLECQSVDGDHGRLETRRCWCVADTAWVKGQGQDWPGLRGLVCVEADREVFGGKRSVERRYFITSHDPREVGAAFLLQAVRGHWGIENRLHWCLDVCFREDGSRVRKGHAAENLSRLRRLALNLLRKLPQTKRVKSLKNKRLLCSWDHDYLLKALTGPE